MTYIFVWFNYRLFSYYLLLLLPIIDLLQQFEDHVNGIALRKRKKKVISLKISTKKGSEFRDKMK